MGVLTPLWIGLNNEKDTFTFWGDIPYFLRYIFARTGAEAKKQSMCIFYGAKSAEKRIAVTETF